MSSASARLLGGTATSGVSRRVLPGGRDIADIGGLKISLSALHQKEGAGDAKSDQDFFIAFAQTWCTNARPETLRLRANTDPHASAQWRVNGPVSGPSPTFSARVVDCSP